MVYSLPFYSPSTFMHFAGGLYLADLTAVSGSLESLHLFLLTKESKY